MKVTEKQAVVVDESVKNKAEAMLSAALSKKAYNPILLRLAGITPLTDYFLIVSARSNRQAKAIAEAMLERAHVEGYSPVSSEGMTQAKWILLDLGDVIVHVFHEPVREFYDLEGLWRDAPRESFSEAIQKEIDAADSSSADDDDDDY